MRHDDIDQYGPSKPWTARRARHVFQPQDRDGTRVLKLKGMPQVEIGLVEGARRRRLRQRIQLGIVLLCVLGITLVLWFTVEPAVL